MQPRTIARLFLLTTLLPLAAHVVAARESEVPLFSGSRAVRLTSDALFDGQPVEEGLYQLTWGLTGPDSVEIHLYQGKRMVHSATGRLVARASASRYDAVVFTHEPTGERKLTEIRFEGSESAIVLVAGTSVAGSR